MIKEENVGIDDDDKITFLFLMLILLHQQKQ
jgi:hypothetical protein